MSLMTQEDEKKFNHLEKTLWLSLGENRLVRAKCVENNNWELGNVIVHEDELIAVFHTLKEENFSKFHLIHQGWKAAAFRKFRPLIYFCAFYDPIIFKCVKLAIRSLIEFSKWEYEVAVITGESSVEELKKELIFPEIEGKFHIIPVCEEKDKLDWCLSRYNLNSHFIFQEASPILYLDADIICDKPLDQLFLNLVNSSFVHVCKEGRMDEGSLESAGHWYGWRLMAEDQVPFDPLGRGFSSGIIGFSGAQCVEEAFSLIRESAYHWVEMFGERENLQSFDQKFANYIFRKLGLCEIDMMAKWVNIYRIPQQGSIYPNPVFRHGIVHFLAADLTGKLEAMQSYFDAVKKVIN